MTTEQDFSKEPEFNKGSPFNETLTRLSDETNPTPLTPDKINISEIKNQLLDASININLIEQDPSLVESIKNPQFRNANQGRGPAMVAALGGKENLEKFFNWTISMSGDQKKLTNGDDESRARGLRQFIADTVALTTGNLSTEEYCRKTNWRVGKKYQKNPEISKQFNLPTDEKGLKKLKEISSIPKGSAVKAYEFILNLNK
jgi:hypothetical protein